VWGNNPPSRVVGFFVAAGLGGQRLARPFIVEGRQMRFDRLIALRNLLMVEGRQLDGLASGKQGLSAPGALQRLGAVGLGVVAVGVAQRRQALRVALAREDGLKDGHAGHASDFTDDLGQLAMHLF
jgi:hypothetical protein